MHPKHNFDHTHFLNWETERRVYSRCRRLHKKKKSKRRPRHFSRGKSKPNAWNQHFTEHDGKERTFTVYSRLSNPQWNTVVGIFRAYSCTKATSLQGEAALQSPETCCFLWFASLWRRIHIAERLWAQTHLRALQMEEGRGLCRLSSEERKRTFPTWNTCGSCWGDTGHWVWTMPPRYCCQYPYKYMKKCIFPHSFNSFCADIITGTE